MIGTLLGLSACIEHTVYHSFQSVAADGWAKGDTLCFQVPVTDSLIPLQLYAEVRNQNNFAYRELYLFVRNNLKDSTVWHTDTLKFVLADQDDKWTGTGQGNLYQSSVPFGSTHVQHPGTYAVQVMQGMKDDKLIGLSDIGIRIGK